MRHKYGYKTSSREQIMYFLCTYLKYFFFFFFALLMQKFTFIDTYLSLI